MADSSKSIKNKLSGLTDKVAGEAREQYGKISEDRKTVVEGKRQKVKGQEEETYGKALEDHDQDR